ncbi:proton conductor component of flagella motor [Wigglesworthia glossinidia endosymbiont of Glossina morsitans morsitans (Yale colony)]|uniref:Proton conductor component of flagella motor n=1 Tax=Wigglesworthia glossinidia endosymbiont of Glossina morsitans morsitans (Yale colony) TaxID=1142511 RepID=H6Q4B3_WIGGL|nr:flagellar motor stator protein MotA [Wigglesworthia glossinidia]AFA40896.1 proton conductor component of flagella motor [Wigglesworthia glossinidia endosymbiont of Glossina morsitans morsitans (Yale colony)]
MLIIIGYCVVFVSVFGGFLLAEGQIGALFQPVELLIILGAGLGAFIVGNNGKSIFATIKAFPKLFHSSRYNKDMYMDVMSLIYRLLSKSRQSGLISLEKDIDNPETSKIFSNYPLMLKDKLIIDFLVDYLRLMISGNLNAYEIEALMNEEIETCEQEHEVPITSLLQVGDALPAFGIVAAVMGVVNALAAADRPAAELGELIAHAMVGTFLGILLAYGCVMPLGALLKQKSDEHIKMLQCIKITLLSSINGYAPQIAIEFGRKILYSSERPSFTELEEHLRQVKKSGLESRNDNATVNS